MEREDRNRHVDEVFRARLSDLNVTPPADVWKGVESALPAKKKVRVLPVFRLAAATLLLLVLTGSLWLIYLNKPSGGDLAGRSVFSDDTSSSAKAVDHNRAPERVAPPAAAVGVTRRPTTEPPKEAVPATTPVAAGSGRVRTFLRPLALHEEGLPGEEIPPLKIPHEKDNALSYVHMLRPGTPALHLPEGPLPAETERRPTYSWGIGAAAGPLFSYRNLPVKNEYTRFLNAEEKGTLSYGGSFSFFVKRKKRLSIETGLSYYRTGQVSTDMVAFRQVKSGNLALLESKGNHYLYNSGGVPGYSEEALFIANHRDPAGNDQTGYILTYLGQGLYEPVDARLDLQYEFVEVPLVVRYRVVDKAFGVSLMGGMGASLLFDSRADVTTADGTTATLGHLDGVRRSNVNSIIGIGFSYKLNEDFLFRMEPTFRYYINSVSDNAGIDAHPYLFGVYSGLSIYF